MTRAVPGDADAADGMIFLLVGPRGDRNLVIEVIAVLAALDLITPGQGCDDMFRSPPVVGIIDGPAVPVQFDIQIQERDSG